mgnify:FL=1
MLSTLLEFVVLPHKPGQTVIDSWPPVAIRGHPLPTTLTSTAAGMAAVTASPGEAGPTASEVPDNAADAVSPRRAAAAPSSRNAGPKDAAALLRERQKIDAAMALLDAAKAKAAAQRVEYSKFLSWKVTMQRKERAQREKEDAMLRERVQERLQTMLQFHKTKKREELSRYSQFIHSDSGRSPRSDIGSGGEEGASAQDNTRSHASRSAPLAHRRPPKLSKYEEEELEFQQRMKEQRAESKRLIHERLQKAKEGGGNSSSALSSGRKQHQRGKRRGTLTNASSAHHNSTSGAPSSSSRSFDPSGINVERLFHSIKGQTGAAIESESGSLPPVQHLEIGAFAPTAPKDAPTAAQQRRLDLVDGSRHHTEKRTAVVAAMFQNAKTRRLYATNRMLADPPADFLIGHDLLRYVPADVMDSVARTMETSAPTSGRRSPARGKPHPGASASSVHDDGSSFFITAASGAAGGRRIDGDPTLEELSGDAEERYYDDGAAGGGLHLVRRKRDQQAIRPFDRDAWMNLPERPSVKVESVRSPEEEKATLAWYYRFYEPLCGIKKRTEAHIPSHSWTRQPRHVLPFKGPPSFDKE